MPPPEESDFSEKFILIKQIEEIKSHEKTQYVPDTETYRMDKDFKFTVNAVSDHDDYLPMFTELPADYMENENNKEFIRLLERIEELKTFKNETTGKISLYLDKVKFKFTELYKKNNLTKPELKEQNKEIEIKESTNGNENNLKLEIFNKLKKPEINKKVLQKLPKKEQKENRKWSLSSGQVYNTYFGNAFPNDKTTIVRYIKLFRSQNTKKT